MKTKKLLRDRKLMLIAKKMSIVTGIVGVVVIVGAVGAADGTSVCLETIIHMIFAGCATIATAWFAYQYLDLLIIINKFNVKQSKRRETKEAWEQ